MANSAISTSKPKTCQDIAYYRDIDYEIMPARIAKIQKDFKNYTEKIRGPPHDPQHWIQRATWFLEKNRWPLLAAAEAYKVHKWFCCPRFRHELGLNRIPDSELKKMQSNAGKILVKALLELNDVVMAGYYCKLLDVPLAQEGRTKIDCLCLEDNKSTINPKMKSLQYPWLPGPFLDRKNYLQVSESTPFTKIFDPIPISALHWSRLHKFIQMDGCNLFLGNSLKGNKTDQPSDLRKPKKTFFHTIWNLNPVKLVPGALTISVSLPQDNLNKARSCSKRRHLERVVHLRRVHRSLISMMRQSKI